MSEKHAREMILGLGFVSPELTACAETWLLRKFPGFFRMDGVGGYTFRNGDKETESALRYVIGTSEDSAILAGIVRDFAAAYCAAGNQESIYWRDRKGFSWIVDAAGNLKAC